jgi:hypothetical protein
MRPFEHILRHYDQHHRTRADAELWWFVRQPSLHAAITNAALARTSSGKRFDHQRRLAPAALKDAARALLDAERDIATCRTFDDLYALIRDRTRHLWNNAELYWYDTALRIGAKLGLQPRSVYLHCGTLIGARRLHLPTTPVSLERSMFPPGLCDVEARTLEDILCIYKDDLSGGTRRRRDAGSGCPG